MSTAYRHMIDTLEKVQRRFKFLFTRHLQALLY